MKIWPEAEGLVISFLGACLIFVAFPGFLSPWKNRLARCACSLPGVLLLLGGQIIERLELWSWSFTALSNQLFVVSLIATVIFAVFYAWRYRNYGLDSVEGRKSLSPGR